MRERTMRAKDGCLAIAVILSLVTSSIIVLIALPQEAIAETHAGGIISTDTVWTLAGNPYIVDSDITITAGVSLTVEAGVEVYVANESEFEVYGGFTVAGSSALPVTFQNASGSLLWSGIRTYSTARLMINNTDLGYIMPFSGAGIYASGTQDIVLDNVTLGSSFHGIRLVQTHNVTFERVTCNSEFGVYFENDQNTTVLNSTFDSWSYGTGLTSGIYGIGSDYLRIENSRFDAAGSGLSLTNLTSPYIHNSSFHIHAAYGNMAGLYLDNASDVRIDNSSVIQENSDRMSSSYWWALLFKSVRNVNVTDNEFISRDSTYGFDMKVILQENTTIVRNRFESSRRLMVLDQGILWNDTCCGNFWTGYNGSDWNGDGLGDTPVFIANESWDRHPIIMDGSCYRPGEPPLLIPPGITQVTYEASNQTSPQIYHNFVMWRDSGRQKNILYDFQNDSEILLPHGGFLFKDRIVDIVGSVITEYQLSTNRSLERYRPISSYDSVPLISDRYLVWNINDGIDEAYLSFKDLFTGATQRYARWAGWSGDKYDIDGELVAYSRWNGHFMFPPSCEEVFMTSLKDGWIQQLTYFNYYGSDPCFDGGDYSFGRVHATESWIVFDAGLWDSWTYPPELLSEQVYLWSIRDGNLTRLSPDGVWAYSPDVSEDWAVWLDNSTGDSDIVLLNLTSWKTYRLPRPGEQLNPRIYRNIITWQDRVNGTWQIFVANLSFALTDVEAVPSVQDVGLPVSIQARLLNMRATDSVRVEVRDPTGGLMVDSTMTQISPDAYKYDHAYTDLGTYVFTVFARDDLGQEISSGGSFRIADATAPKITITSPAPASTWVTNVTPVDLAGTSSDNSQVANVTWRNFATGESGTATGTVSWAASVTLTNGSNPITVTAWDASGNKGNDAITVKFDPDPPSVTISSPVDGQAFSYTSIVAAGSSSDVGSSGLDRVEVRVNGGSWKTATGIASWTSSVALERGPNLIEARAWDKALNPSTIVSVTAFYDPDPPDVAIADPLDGQAVATSPILISGTASDVGSSGLNRVEVRVNNAPWVTADGTSSWSLTATLALGPNLIEARAWDNAGLPSIIRSVTVTYDPLPPSVTIYSPAGGESFAIDSITVSGSASDPGVSGIDRVEIRVNGGSWATAVGKSTWAATVILAPGSNTIDARALDNAGNPSPISSVTVVYDSSAPMVTISKPTDGETLHAMYFNVSGTASDVGTSGLDRVEVRVNGGTWFTAIGNSAWSCTVIFSIGSNSIEARARDNAGNPSSTATVSISYQPLPPIVHIDSPISGEILSSMPVVVSGTANDTGNGLDRVDVRANGGPWQTASGTTSWSLPVSLFIGINTIYAQAWDDVGNPSTIATIYVEFDPIQPSVSILSPSNGSIVATGRVTVSGVADDLGSGLNRVMTRVNGGLWLNAMGTLSWSASLDLTQGPNFIESQAWDKAGLASPIASITIVSDQVPPIVEILSPADRESFTDTPIPVYGMASDDGGSGVESVEVRVNGGIWQSATGTSTWVTTVKLSFGLNVIEARSTDMAGTPSTIDAIEASYVPYSNRPPSAAFDVTPLSGRITTLYVVDASISFDNEDPAAQLEVRWDWENDGIWDADWSTVKTVQHRYAVPGVYTISMEVRDTAGLASSTTRQITVVNMRPEAALSVTPSSGNVATVFTVDASASTDLEDLAASLEFRWDWEDDGVWDTDWSTANVATHAFATPGTYLIRVEVKDQTGLTDSATTSVMVASGGEVAPPLLWISVIVLAIGMVVGFLIMKKSRSQSKPQKTNEGNIDDVQESLNSEENKVEDHDQGVDGEG